MIGADKLKRLAGVLWWPALPVLAVVAWANLRLVPHWDWSACRLAASIRIAEGFPLYTPPGSAVLNTWIYGPVAPLAYLPAALAASPLGALRIATGLNALYFLLPLAVLLAPRWRDRAQRLTAGWAGVFGLAAVLLPFGVWYGAAVLHVDNVANGLGVLSCVALVRWRRPWSAALLWALAVWTKQTVPPLALAHLLFVGWREGVGAALGQAGRLAVTGLGLAAIWIGWFGGPTLWWNLVVLPSRHPIEWAALGGQLSFALSTTWWIAPVVLAAVCWRPPRRDEAADPEVQLGWMLMLAAAVLLPLGIVSMLKVDGGQNSLHSLAYGILGATSLGAALIESGRPRVAAVALAALLAGGSAILAIKCQRVFAHGYLTAAMAGEQHVEAYAFAQAHPGESYFPWDPLVTLMADRRDYPTADGYRNWLLAGAAPPKEQIRRQFPATIKYVVCNRDNELPADVLALFPEFTERREAGRWWVYTRPRPVANPSR